MRLFTDGNMGYKGTLLSLADSLASVGFSLNRKLPTYYQGYWIWLPRKSWSSLFSRYEPYIARAIKNQPGGWRSFWDIGAKHRLVQPCCL